MGPRLSEQVCYALYSTSRSLTQAYKALLDPLSLTYPQFVVMMALWESGSVKITDISDLTGLSNATLTPILNRLVDIGYVRKASIAEDERQKVIQLTPQGKGIAGKAKAASEKALCATGLTATETRTLMRLCDKVRKNVSPASELPAGSSNIMP